jgi:nucleotide-binding universal stress UspA family protein
MDIRRILVPVDFSAYSEKACDWAFEMAEQWRAHVLLLHVIPRPNYPPMLMGSYFNIADFEAGLRAEAETRAKDFMAKTQTRPVPTDARIIIGEPFSDICQVAAQEKIDLIVMGSHGRTGLSHVLLGSVTERVIRLAPCPVLVVGRSAPA